MPLPGSRSASFPGWWSGSRQASSMRGAGSKPPAAPSLKTSFCSGGLRLPLRWSASSASAATSRGARHRVALRRAARRTRRVGLRCTAASACAFARRNLLLRLRLLSFGFFSGICGDLARRAASSRAASSCATDAPRRAAPHGRVGVRVRATKIASPAPAASIWLPRLSLTARRTRRAGLA